MLIDKEEGINQSTLGQLSTVYTTMFRFKISILTLLMTLSYAGVHGQLLPLQNPDSVRAELEDLFSEMRRKHPGFYRYNDSTAFDNYIDSTLGTIQEPLHELDILRKVRPIIARIGCLHTGIRLSDSTSSILNEFPNCLPIGLYWHNSQAVIWTKMGTSNEATIGDTVIAINGRKINEVYKQLLSSIPMDGYNESGKLKLLQYTFPDWYRAVIEVTEQFEIETADGKKYSLDGIRHEDLLSYEDIIYAPMSLQVTDKLAIVRIPSFSNSYLKVHDQSFKKMVDSYFETMEQGDVTTLMIDLRGNTGGSDSNPAYLSSFFFDQPYRYWDKITVTKPLAVDVKGLMRVFYGKPTLRGDEYHWSTKGIASGEFQFVKTQQPSKSPFLGNVYLLTDGLCMSSCSDFVAILQSNNKANVIGEETGGGYQGNNSGLIPSTSLSCGLVIDIPLLSYWNHVDKMKNIGRGTTPDFASSSSFSQVLDPKNYLDEVLSIIQSQKTQ